MALQEVSGSTIWSNGGATEEATQGGATEEATRGEPKNLNPHQGHCDRVQPVAFVSLIVAFCQVLHAQLQLMLTGTAMQVVACTAAQGRTVLVQSGAMQVIHVGHWG